MRPGTVYNLCASFLLPFETRPLFTLPVVVLSYILAHSSTIYTDLRM